MNFYPVDVEVIYKKFKPVYYQPLRDTEVLYMGNVNYGVDEGLKYVPNPTDETSMPTYRTFRKFNQAISYAKDQTLIAT